MCCTLSDLSFVICDMSSDIHGKADRAFIVIYGICLALISLLDLLTHSRPPKAPRSHASVSGSSNRFNSLTGVPISPSLPVFLGEQFSFPASLSLLFVSYITRIQLPLTSDSLFVFLKAQ